MRISRHLGSGILQFNRAIGSGVDADEALAQGEDLVTA